MKEEKAATTGNATMNVTTTKSTSTTITTTLTITEALAEHRSKKRKRNNGPHHQYQYQYQYSHHQRPMDIAVVILSMTIDYQRKFITIMIGDHSIQSHECARIFVNFKYLNNKNSSNVNANANFNVNEKKSNTNEKENKYKMNAIEMNLNGNRNRNGNDCNLLDDMKVGDVLRFNNVFITKDYYMNHPQEDEIKNNNATDNNDDNNYNDHDNGNNHITIPTHNSITSTSTRRHKLTTVVCDFSYNWRVLETTDQFICRISKMMPISFKLRQSELQQLQQQQQQQQQQYNLGHNHNHNEFNFVMEAVTSSNMITSKTVVERILQWFQISHHRHHMESSSAHITTNSNIMTTMKDNNYDKNHDHDLGSKISFDQKQYQQQHMNKKPIHKRRNIKDLKLAPNIISDVVVRIQSLHGGNGGKYQRLVNSNNNNNNRNCSYNYYNNNISGMYIILSDYNCIRNGEDHDIIPFICDFNSTATTSRSASTSLNGSNNNNNLYKQLQDAFEKQHIVLLSNVLTQRKPSSIHFCQKYRLIANDYEFDYILLPTSDTSITILDNNSNGNSNDTLYNINNHNNNNNKTDAGTATSATEGSINYSTCTSPILSSSPASPIQIIQNYGLNEHFRNRNDTIESSLSSSSSLFVIDAQLLSIYFEDLDVKLTSDNKHAATTAADDDDDQNCWPSDIDLFQILLLKDDKSSRQDTNTRYYYTYRPSILTLQLSKRTEERMTQDCIKVHANADIMSTLCGSFDPCSLMMVMVADLKEDGSDKQRNQSNYLLVSDLIRGLIYLDNKMEWTLIRHGDGRISVKEVFLTSMGTIM